MEAPPRWLGSIALTRVDATLQPAREWRLPPNPTVTLRGAVGAAFMGMACRWSDDNCADCRDHDTCPVPAWFDRGLAGNSRPRPLVPELVDTRQTVANPDQPVQFRWWVLGRVPEGAPLLDALVEAAAGGLGRDRVPHVVQSLRATGGEGPASLVLEGERVADWPEPACLADFVHLPERPAGATVHLETPLSWKGAKRRRRPTVADVVKCATIRMRAVASSQGISVDRWWPAPRSFPGRWERSRWHEAERFSSRQDEVIDLSGWLGSIRFGPEVASIADLIAAVEIVHLGRATSTGAGRITVAWEEEEP